MALTWHYTLRFGDEIYKEGDCLSTDTKPTTDETLMNGSKLTEIDTSIVYCYNKDDAEWIEYTGGGSGTGGMEIHICAEGEYNAQTGVPTIAEPDTKTFYLVPDGTGNDLFVEWIYVNDAWEKFGSARIDLSGYITGVTVNGTSVVTSGVANIPIADGSTPGVVKVDNASSGLQMATGQLQLSPASANDIKAGLIGYKAVVPSTQNAAVFYGLAKAAGDSTQASSSNAVGTYTSGAKTAIKTMLGVESGVTDVQIVRSGNTYSTTVTDGVAKIPWMTTTQFGIGKGSNTYGTDVGSGNIKIYAARNTDLQFGMEGYRPIVPAHQHESTFYGLAKAAGDTTMSEELSPVIGTYTDEAKAAIQTMLGVEQGVSYIESVSGTTPSITGVANTRYKCGECSTLTIAPPATGTIEVQFASGSTATVLTVTPPTGVTAVKWPAWFDETSLDADTTYDIIITDGEFGSVMAWAD